jgi:hypothetical protein
MAELATGEEWAQTPQLLQKLGEVIQPDAELAHPKAAQASRNPTSTDMTSNGTNGNLLTFNSTTAKRTRKRIPTMRRTNVYGFVYPTTGA